MKRHPSTLARPCPDCAENKRELAALRRLAKGLKASLEHHSLLLADLRVLLLGVVRRCGSDTHGP